MEFWCIEYKGKYLNVSSVWGTSQEHTVLTASRFNTLEIAQAYVCQTSLSRHLIDHTQCSYVRIKLSQEVMEVRAISNEFKISDWDEEIVV